MGLTQSPEVGGVVEIMLVAFLGRRAVDLAAAVEGLPAQSGVSGHLGGEVYGQTVGPCLLAVGFQRACVILGLQVVGQVDHKAGVAAARTSATRLPSSNTIRSSERNWLRRLAAARPAKPAPITSQSALVFSESSIAGSAGGSRAFHAAGRGLGAGAGR